MPRTTIRCGSPERRPIGVPNCSHWRRWSHSQARSMQASARADRSRQVSASAARRVGSRQMMRSCWRVRKRRRRRPSSSSSAQSSSRACNWLRNSPGAWGFSSSPRSARSSSIAGSRTACSATKSLAAATRRKSSRRSSGQASRRARAAASRAATAERKAVPARSAAGSRVAGRFASEGRLMVYPVWASDRRPQARRTTSKRLYIGPYSLTATIEM